jgi:hypothetical protein
MIAHRSNSKTKESKLYQAMRENDDWKMEVYSEFPCENRSELTAEEERVRQELGAELNTLSCHGRDMEKYRKWLEGQPERERKYREANAERRKQYYRDYREANHEACKKAQCDWYEANKDRILHERREQYEANKEAKLKYQKEYAEKNKERIKEYNRAWREKKKQEKEQLKFGVEVESSIS